MARRRSPRNNRRNVLPGQALCNHFETCGYHHDDEWLGRFGRVDYIVETLQGYTAKSYDEKDRVMRCIKAASRAHVEAGVSLRGTRVHESFVAEQALLVKISSMPDVPASICRYIVGWDSATVHYYAMEYVSHGALFHFMKNVLHAEPALAPTVQERVYMGKSRRRFLPNNAPYKRLKVIAATMAQTVDAVAWLHSKSIVHLDLSLENILKANSDIFRPKIKIIDWGVAKDFSATRKVEKYGRKIWLYDKDVGKPGYKANEVRQCASSRVRRRRGRIIPYDAEAAEIWTFGTMLYLMVFRAYPFQSHADVDDPFYVTIMQGQLRQWFAEQGWSCWLTRDCFDFLNRIWQPEARRITMSEILRHPFIEMGREWLRHDRSPTRVRGESARSQMARRTTVNDRAGGGGGGVAERPRLDQIQRQATEQISTVDRDEEMQVSMDEGRGGDDVDGDRFMAGTSRVTTMGAAGDANGGISRQQTFQGMAVDQGVSEGGLTTSGMTSFPSLQRQGTQGDGDVEMIG